jgi:DNA-directed RNA polymerase subunit RPC12/RpoP
MDKEKKKWDSNSWRIICPHCGYEHYEWHDYIDTGDMDGAFDMDCEDCGESFVVKFRTLIDFQSEKKSDTEE